MKATHAIRLVILLPALMLQSGCTVMLWRDTQEWDAHRVPAQPNHLQVFDDSRRRDFLVVYDELWERTDGVHPRAYYLRQNERRIEERRRPDFVSLRRARELKPIPVYLGTYARSAALAKTTYVVGSPDDDRFTLHSNDEVGAQHVLPTYGDGIGQAGRIVLTPFAITTDATWIGAWIFVEAWAHGGMSWN
jgi:hypothetical protein